MANDIKQNITSDELEQYGVWVKKAPRDCDTASTEISPETCEVYPEDALPKVQNVLKEAADFSETDETTASPAADESAEMLPEEIDINDFLSETDSAAESNAGGVSEEIDISSFLDEAESVNMDDFMIPGEKQEKPNEIVDEPPLAIDLTFDDSFSKNTEADPVENVETDIVEELSIDSSFDNFDDMFNNIKDESIPNEPISEAAKSVPEPAEPAVIDDTPIPDASSAVQNMQMDEVTEFDDLLNSLSDDAPADSGKNNSAESFQAKTVKEYTLNVSADDEDAFSAKQDGNEDGAEIENIALFDQDSKDSLEKQQNQDYNISSPAVGVATEEELSELDALIDAAVSEDAPAEKKTDIPQENPMDDMTKLLDKIMNEISALRNEFSSLKNDVEELKQTEGAVREPAAKDIQPPAPEEQTGGFFNDETEDETIALSGDELDDILNSADFTEETSFTDEESVQEEKQESSDTDIDAEIAFEEPDCSCSEEKTAEETCAEQLEMPAISEDTEENSEVSEYDSFTEATDAQSEPSPFDFETENLEEPVLDDMQFALEDQEENENFDENILSEPSESVNSETESDAIEIDNEPDITDQADILDAAENEMAEAEDISIPDEADDTADTANVEEELSDNLSAEEPTEAVFSGSQWNDVSDDQEASDIETAEADDGNKELEANAEEAISSTAACEPETAEETVEQEITDVIVPDFDNDTAAEEDSVSDSSGSNLQQKTEETPAEEQNITETMKEEIKNVLSYMDQLLENLPEEKIEEFARSEHFEVYKKLFKELGLS